MIPDVCSHSHEEQDLTFVVFVDSMLAGSLSGWFVSAHFFLIIYGNSSIRKPSLGRAPRPDDR